MQCYITDGTGLEGLRLVERPEPGDPGPGEVLINVHAVSLNYRDLMIARGQYGGKPLDPFIAGSDMAGVVAKVGGGVTEFKPGDRVLNSPFRFWPGGLIRSAWIPTFIGANGVDGVLAEQIIYPAVSLVPVPQHMDFRMGSTLTIAGLTAWSAVVTHAQSRPGEWILLYGTGGVSIFAAQIARMLGMRIILTTSSDEKAKRVEKELGVEATLDYRLDDWPDSVHQITRNHGADVIVDVVGGGTLNRSIKAAAINGRIMLIGVLDGLEGTVRGIDILRKQLTIRGIFMESTQELRAFARACETAELTPWIDRTFSFEQAREAYGYLQSQRHIGKVVIDVRRPA